MSDFADLQRLELGEIEVLYLPDGGGRSDPLSLFPASDSTGWSLYNKWLDDEGRTVTSIGSFAIRYAERMVLVDAGIGPTEFEIEGFGSYQGGRLLESLARAGISPEDITDLFFTHLHVDHIGWALQPGTQDLCFPNARHLVHAEEWAYWSGGDDPNGPSPTWQATMAPHLEMLSGGDEIAPGLRVVEAFGHTPGHCMLLLEPGGEERLYIIGDLLYGPQQVEQSDWNPVFDVDPALSQSTREAFYPALTAYGTQAAAGHFPLSVFGQIRGMGYGRMWLPAGL